MWVRESRADLLHINYVYTHRDHHTVCVLHKFIDQRYYYSNPTILEKADFFVFFYLLHMMLVRSLTDMGYRHFLFNPKIILLLNSGIMDVIHMQLLHGGGTPLSTETTLRVR